MVETLSDIGNKEVKHKALNVLTALVAGADTGLVEIVPEVTDKKIVVVNLRLTGLSLQDAFLGNDQVSQLEFFSDSTAITGKWQATFNWWMDAGYNPDGHFQTEAGEALQYKLTDTRTSGGSETAGLEIMLSYIEK